ncbi:hypothetical protein X798_03365 [Onchocerca flexuosa]|uniref:GRIP domain-containing protein n=1 Tax=Onchocerca flexuosa TaxID=387005 RepID=A0A238BWG9_9BILA|nr:hypothetical protein X798_03365 [Onchocerca flexuosa]
MNDSEDFSNENTLESRNAGENHKAILQIDLGNEEKAQMICRTLAVDKEPSRIDMFKGLKSKLEDEAKRLQATVSQYGENIAQQVRSGVNEQNPNCSAMMQEVPEQDLLSESRQRRNSSGSLESENSFSNLFSAIPGMLSSGHRLNTITSDVENESVATSSQFQSASKEQISTVLHKLQGRATNYKDKYRRIIQMYNELVRENEKYQEAKEREAEENKMKELQELVEKYHSNMKEKKERIRQLTEENERLKKKIETSYDEQGISDLAVQRVTAEWKDRMDCLEEKWSKRFSDSEEANTLEIAKVKAEMHRALEEKDGELQIARDKCKVLELSEIELQKQIGELRAAVDALENEKVDMVEKLSEAKQQGVKAVRCEEEEKRQKLKKEMESRRVKEREEDERLFQEMIMKNDEQWALKFKEQEEQMQLAIEEREMQKVAAVIEHDRKNENLGVQVEQLTAEKLHLKSVLDDMKERHRQQMDELCISIEANKERHQQEINEIKQTKEEVITTLKKDFEAAIISNKLLEDELKGLRSSKQKAVEGAENRNEELINDLTMERQIIDHLKKQYENDIEIMRTEMSALKEDYEKVLKENSAKEKELIQRNAEMKELKQELIELSQKLLSKQKEMEELYGNLEQKIAIIMSLESEKEILSAELASTQELSKIHQHLQQQLKATQMERDETEKRYLEMEEKVQKAIQELEVDRRILQQEKQELEEKKLNSHQWIAEMSKCKADEMKYEMQQAQEEIQKANNDLDEKIASLTDENKQLKNQLEDHQAQIKKLEGEKDSLVKELEYIRKKAESESKEEDMNMVLNEKIIFLERNMEDTDFKSLMDIKEQDSVLLEDVELEESCASDTRKLSSSKVDSLNEKNEVLEELRKKLNLVENEKSSFLANIEALEKNLQKTVEEKNSVMKEMEDIRGNRDNLKIKIEEMEVNFRETSCKNNSEIEKLKKELRVQENIVSELQKKIKEQGVKENTDLESLKQSLKEERKRQLVLENELAETKENLDKVKIELQERKNNEEFLEIELNKKRKEKENEQKTRNEYALALKNANDSLEETQKQLADLDLVRIEKDRFVSELSLAKKDYQRIVQKLKQENQEKAEEIKKKAEHKILKMKKQYETDGKAAKAELLLQIDEMRSQIAEKDLQIEKQKFNISSLEQKLCDESKNEKVMDDLRATIQAISNERDKELNKCAEMKIQQNSMRATIEETMKQLELQSQQITLLQESTERLKQEREILIHEKENLGKEVGKLQLEIITLQNTASEESAKVSAKMESERYRLLRDLQKEIKQLYHDLNERTQQLNEAQSKLQELSAKKTENDEIGDICAETDYKLDSQTKRLRTNSDLIEQANYEELCTLREQVVKYQKQLENTKETHKKELTLLCEKACGTEQFNVIGLESIINGSVSSVKEDLSDKNLVFVESTEAEYLRNILYRYMNERETLGKESVTLARVIATVARFSHEQVNAVVAKEEQRNHGWVEDADGTLVVQSSNPVLSCLKRRQF